MNHFEKALKGLQRELELEEGEHRSLEETFEFKYILISILCHSSQNILYSETHRTNQKIPNNFKPLLAIHKFSTFS